MLRLTGKRTSRISNRLAIFAALLLVVTSLAGAGGSALTSYSAATSVASETTDRSTPVSIRSRGFKVSLLLFRHNK
ncbi:MAG: hypothetical protein OES53_06145 [Xanthomonadales bacterium]|jgi:hypothetical protein|nr:hypothetical protein [Xanthomonadales bacterium]MDH3923075.1 hypothetical protein [Xanthomonadales bacterium]MDH3941943.1 hypothetical protein [Xanthomonadales bacterium]MDH3999920.1 hypothetical protein [Xanthomonadales bacterium]